MPELCSILWISFPKLCTTDTSNAATWLRTAGIGHRLQLLPLLASAYVELSAWSAAAYSLGDQAINVVEMGACCCCSHPLHLPRLHSRTALCVFKTASHVQKAVPHSLSLTHEGRHDRAQLNSTAQLPRVPPHNVLSPCHPPVPPHLLRCVCFSSTLSPLSRTATPLVLF